MEFKTSFMAIVLLSLAISCTTNPSELQEPDSPSGDLAPADEKTPPATVSASDLSLHSAADDCWVGYKGMVYDVTGYLNQHPGGAEKIISLCGTADMFEQKFEGKHGTSKVSVLEDRSALIGVLG
jgi:cytochrome b involved in lipid metabolism